MKKTKRIVSIILAAVLLIGSVSVFANAASVSVTNTDYGYMVPTNSKYSKVLSKVTLYGNYDYLNFYINAELYKACFFYEIYSDEACTTLVASDFVNCSIGSFTYSPLIKLKGVFKSGTYYCVTYAARINENTGDIKISKPSMVAFEIVVKRTADFSQLTVPLNSVKATLDGPMVTWSKLSSNAVEKYHIYRRTIDGTKWTKVGTVSGSENSYTDTSIKNKNGEFVYTVKAVDKNGKSSRYHYGGVECFFIAAPTIESVSTIADNKIKVQWQPTGASFYKIYRKTNGGKWEVVCSEVWGYYNTFTDTNVVSGNNYEYTVRGVIYDYNGLCNAGKSVDYVAGPVLKTVTVADIGLNINWEAVQGATAYTVYRKTLNSKEAWTKLECVSSETLSYNDKTADNQGAYSYTVRAEGTTSRGSYNSKGIEYVILQHPEYSVRILGCDKLEVSFTKVPYANSYTLYLKNADGEWEKLGVSNSGSLYMEKRGLFSKYKEYEFALSAANGKTETDYTNNVKKIIYTPTTATYCSIYNDYNYISWSSTSTGIYNLYRKNKDADNSEYQLIYSGENSYYKDTDVEYGVGYTYLAKAVLNSVEQSKSLYPISKIRYNPEEYIESFEPYGEFYAKEKWYRFPYKLKKAAEGMRVDMYILEKDGLYVGWSSFSDPSELIPATTEPQFSLVVYDNMGSTPIDGFIVPVKNEKCDFVELKYEGVKDGLRLYWNNVEGAIEYKITLVGDARFTKNIIANKSGVNSMIISPSELPEQNSYTFKIEAVHSNGNRSISYLEDVYYTDEIPRILMVTSTDNGVVVDFEDTYGSYVFRKAQGETSWTKMGFFRSRYVDKTAKKGVKYTYTVRAYDSKNKCYSSYYDKKGLKVGEIATPILYPTENKNGGVLLQWEDMHTYNSAHYNIYRRTDGSKWEKIGTNYATEGMAVSKFTDTNVKSGTIYYYTVRAFTNTNVSAYDKTGVFAQYLAAPEYKPAANTATGVKLSWNKVAGATKYRVYRKENIYDRSWEVLGNVTNTSYLDTKAEAGVGYRYRVKAYSDNAVSAHSKSDITIYRLEMPALVSAQNAKNGVKVEWKPVADAQGYYVYRKTAGSGWSRIANTSETTYVDKTAKGGTTYYYTVKAYLGSHKSAHDTDGISVKCLTTPALTSATRSSSGITVKWGKVTGADGYYVYRKTSDSGWSKIGTVKGGSAVAFKDKTAKAGTTYYYTVKAYSGSTTSGYVSKGIKCS